MAHTKNNPITEKSPYDGSIRISQGKNKALSPGEFGKVLDALARSIEPLFNWARDRLLEEYRRRYGPLSRKKKRGGGNFDYELESQVDKGGNIIPGRREIVRRLLAAYPNGYSDKEREKFAKVWGICGKTLGRYVEEILELNRVQPCPDFADKRR